MERLVASPKTCKLAIEALQYANKPVDMHEIYGGGNNSNADWKMWQGLRISAVKHVMSTGVVCDQLMMSGEYSYLNKEGAR